MANSKRSANRPSTRPALAHEETGLRGGILAPSWLYFIFYILCRRQKNLNARNFDPTFSSWNGLGAALTAPWITMIVTIDHYVPFLHSLGYMWVELHLPGTPNHAWGYALIILSIITLAIFFIFLFGWRYNSIMREFSSYDKDEHLILPFMILSIAWVSMGISSFVGLASKINDSSHLLLPATLVNMCIFIGAEILFRLWWRRWQLKAGQYT